MKWMVRLELSEASVPILHKTDVQGVSDFY